MLVKFKLPKLAETSDVVVVEAWLVAAGEHVVADQPLVSMETDKVTVDVPSPATGTVTELVVAEGDEVRTGEHICFIHTD